MLKFATEALLAAAADAVRQWQYEAPIDGPMAFDVSFRFGSKYRMKSADEGWEVYKFSDVTSENRTQSGAMKNIPPCCALWLP